MTTSVLDNLLAEKFGFPEFRLGQREAIEAVLKDQAALAVFPTGGGKSLCYQLPALAIEGVTLVVSPLIALMKDQIDFLTRRGIPAARLDSTLSATEVREISERLRTGDLKILYVAPERFNNERFIAEVKRLRIGLFAVDEAHCISEWGHNFRPDYLKLTHIAREINAERILALTATATPKVVKDICEAFSIPDQAVILTGFYRPNLTLLTTPCEPNDRHRLLVDRLRTRPAGSTIVYVTLQKSAEILASHLSKQGFSAEAYHAGMKPEDRVRIQDWWMQTPGGIVVATIAFGMGIDKSDVRYVYHANMPKSLESYSQEIGRAGRDGVPSTVEMFACASDLPSLENFVYGDTPTEKSLRLLTADLLSQPETFDVSNYDLSNTHDLRPLVLRTALTYLELAGALSKGTPFYAGYEFKALVPLTEISKAFPDTHGDFAASLFNVSKQGRIWNSLDPEEAAKALNVERNRVTRALEVMSDRGLIELRSSQVRDRYTRLVGPEVEDRLVADLVERFETKERQEIERLAMVPALIENDGCQVQALVGYFGEILDGPCGHCTFCLTSQRQIIPPSVHLTPMEDLVERQEVDDLAAAHPAELGTPRQIAKLLCGLTSPWFTKSKLSRHPLFGHLEDFRFQDVLKFVNS